MKCLTELVIATIIFILKLESLEVKTLKSSMYIFQFLYIISYFLINKNPNPNHTLFHYFNKYCLLIYLTQKLNKYDIILNTVTAALH